MFEISELKSKRLPELQELAKTLGIPKFRSYRKLDLVYQILDFQAANPQAVKDIVKEETAKTEKPTPSEKPKKETPKRQQSHPKSQGASNTATKQRDSRRSEEHTSELQSRGHLVCRLLLEKKNI